MTGQNIVDAVSSDIRGVLSNTGADATRILGWVDRIHKELLRVSRWKFLLSDVKTFTTTIGTVYYYLGTGSLPPGAVNTSLALTDVEFVKGRSVVDRTNNKRLFKTDEKPLGDTWVLNGRPTLYRYDSALPDTFELLPPADGVYTIEFRYYQKRTPITSLSTVLQIPDDYQDVVIAGVNAMACQFLKKFDEAGPWQQSYQDGKRQMIRDANLFPREDFIRPDYVTLPQDHPSIYDPFLTIF